MISTLGLVTPGEVYTQHTHAAIKVLRFPTEMPATTDQSNSTTQSHRKWMHPLPRAAGAHATSNWQQKASAGSPTDVSQHIKPVAGTHSSISRNGYCRHEQRHSPLRKRCPDHDKGVSRGPLCCKLVSNTAKQTA